MLCWLGRLVWFWIQIRSKLEQGPALGKSHSFFHSIIQQILIEDHSEPSTVLEAEKAWGTTHEKYFLSMIEKFMAWWRRWASPTFLWFNGLSATGEAPRAMKSPYARHMDTCGCLEILTEELGVPQSPLCYHLKWQSALSAPLRTWVFIRLDFWGS